MMKMKHLATFFENLFDLVLGIPGVELFWQGTLGVQYQFLRSAMCTVRRIGL